MNKTEQIGRLTADPDIRIAKNEKKTVIANFSIAVPRKFNKEETDFFPCVAFGNKATFVEKYVKKGDKVAISAHLRQDKWTDKDGNNQQRIILVVDEIEFAQSKAASSNNDDTFMNIPEGVIDNIPFDEDDELIREEIMHYLA